MTSRPGVMERSIQYDLPDGNVIYALAGGAQSMEVSEEFRNKYSLKAQRIGELLLSEEGNG